MSTQHALTRPPALLAWRARDLAWTVGLFALILAWDASAADLWLEHLWSTPHGFPLRDHWLTARVLHDGGRVLAGVVLVALLVNVWAPWTPGVPRTRRVAWVLVTLAALALMPLLKKNSLTSCPWDLAEFGGVAHWVSHWQWGVADGGAGHCFPSGHASSAFAFLAGWFVLRDPHPRLARAWIVAVCVLGALFGWAQAARGAHYASHTMWTAWICWVMAVALLGYRRS